MYGINLLEVAKILGTSTASTLISKHSGISLIYQEIIKFCAERNNGMVKSMMGSLARQNEKAYEEIVEILKKNFTEDELKADFSG
jgi:cytidylate kinase